ncbi:MAG: AsmA-like C-terminal region-containing protein [Aureibaculum sp.]|nr:AsmA-like C-terminal region-containing protein [Aureibaculum sp.]
MKKVIKILTIIFLLCITFIVIVPIIFEGKIIDLVKKTVNNNVNATLSFEDADLSVWSSFPNTQVSLKKVSLVNNAPFEGDTLFGAAGINLKMPLVELFKRSSDISITSFIIDDANLAIRVDKDGNANYNIAKNKNDKGNIDSNESGTFQFGLESYKITNSNISYHDASGKIVMQLSDVNHSGSGNLSLEKSELKTVTTMLTSLQMNGVSYLNKNKIQLEALFDIDLKEKTFRFLDNKAQINQLPLIFDGYVKLNENNKKVAISFKTPSSDFKNFLALIPEVYSKNIEGIATTGNFDVKGTIDGIVDDLHIPEFNISIHSDNASFKYPDLPKSLTNINISTVIANKTGLAKDSYILIDKLSFKIDEDIFNANAKLKDLSENMKVTANLKGIVNLGSLEKIYPAEAVKGLKGILNVDATTSFDMKSIENDHYENTKTSGSFAVSDFEHASEELSNPLKVFKAGVSFNQKTVTLNSFEAQLGTTDLVASGTMNNLLGFIFNEKNLEGKFKLTSNTFSVNDFMVSEVEKDKKNSEIHIKIPSFLDCTIDANAATVLYDNITLRNVSGKLIIKDQRAELKNMKSNVFDGTLGFSGSVSTKEDTPKFQMDLDVTRFNIAQSFGALELFEALAPIANVIEGKINSTISLSGNLNDDFTPDLNSVNGNLLAELISSKISTDKTPLLQKLEQNLNFLDTQKLNLENLKTALSFKDGKVNLHPFKLNYDDIDINVSGSHGFDKSLAYDAVIHVPAKYLGKEASQLIAELNEDELNTIKVPINALISGKFNNPIIKTDLKAAIANLSNQIATKQKEKLIDKGKEQISNALNDLIKGSSKQNDTITKDSLKNPITKDPAKELLEGIFKRTKKKKDSVN